MRRFLIPLVFLATLSWALWGYVLWKVPPESLKNKVFFFSTLFLSLTFSFTFLFFIAKDLFERMKNPQKTRENLGLALRRGLFVALYVIGMGMLKLLGAENFFNLVIFALILLLTEISLTISK